MLTFFRPCLILRPFVRYYWMLDTDETFDALTFPIGCPQLIFHRLTRFFIPELDCAQAKFTISSQVNFPARIQFAGEVETIAVVFHPHAIRTLFDIPVSEFYNQEIDGYSLGHKNLSSLADEVLNCCSPEEAIHRIETWLLSNLSESGIYNFKRIGASLREVLLNPIVSVEEMAQHACMSRKQFERVFFNTIGMKPKEYSTIVRFQRSLHLMQNGSRDFSDIAYSCGYSDQSHFIRECRRYSGLTPTMLLKTQPIYSDLFTSPV